MAGRHITEATWFNARKELPNTPRIVLVLFRCFNKNGYEMRLGEAMFESRTFMWEVLHPAFKPSTDIVTQWAEIDPNRGGLKPDNFPEEQHGITFIGNK